MRNLVILTALFFLSACGNNSSLRDTFDTRQNAGACPPAGSVYNASRIVQFDGDTQIYRNIAYTGEIVDVRLFCRYADEDPVRVQLEIDFAFGKGPKGERNSHAYTYWVAVARRSGKVLNKAYFTVEAPFGSENVTGVSETLNQILIPRADESVSAANFEVLVGFELTRDQITFNKEGQRFRLGAGQ